MSCPLHRNGYASYKSCQAEGTEFLQWLLDVATSPKRRRLAASSTGANADNIPQARMVGQQDWHILFEDESESDLEKRIKKLEQDIVQVESDFDVHAMILGDVYIKNVASEALLFALHEQRKSASLCSRFKVLAQRGDPRMSTLVKSFNDNHVLPVSITSSSMATTLDRVMDSRELAVHNISLAELLLKVANALKLLQCHPSLQGRYSQEYMVLNNYDKIRSAFKV